MSAAKRRDLHVATRDLAGQLHVLVTEFNALVMSASTIAGLARLSENGAGTVKHLVALALRSATEASAKSADLLSALDALGEVQS